MKRTRSGEHAAVRAFRRKLESIQDSTLEDLLDLNRKLDEQLHSSIPPKDPRRDGEGVPPTDKVELPTIHAPPERKP